MRILLETYLFFYLSVTWQDGFKTDRRPFCYRSSDKRDSDIIRENHKFLWADDETPETWEAQLAKKYYDKLFKEYCICDLSRYKENKVGTRYLFICDMKLE